MVIGCSGGGPSRSFWLAEASRSFGLLASWLVSAGVILLGWTSRVKVGAATGSAASSISTSAVLTSCIFAPFLAIRILVL